MAHLPQIPLYWTSFVQGTIVQHTEREIFSTPLMRKNVGVEQKEKSSKRTPVKLGGWRNNALTLLTIGGAILGGALGFGLRAIPRENWWTPREVLYVGFVGELYLRMLTMFVLPLIVCALTTGIARLDLQASWQVAARSAVWLFAIEYIAVIIGIMVAVAIKPGIGISAVSTRPMQSTEGVLAVDTALDVFRNVFPENFVDATMTQEKTILVKNESLPVEEWDITFQKTQGVNIPGLITLSIILGLAIGISLPNSQPLLDFCTTVNKAMMIAIGWVMMLTPIGVMFMVCSKLLADKDLSTLLERLALYFVTVLTGLFIHGLILLPTIYFVFTRKSPFKLLGGMAQAMATAFGTASSTASLPVILDCMENRVGIDGRFVQFFGPIATTFNMDGTALYVAVAIVFISQIRGITLGFAQLLLISITVTTACLGNAGVPQSGLIIIVLILTSIGLPPEDVTIIVAVDWLLDRFRTTVNVISDSVGAGVVEHLSQYQLASINTRKYSRVPQAEEQYEMRSYN